MPESMPESMPETMSKTMAETMAVPMEGPRTPPRIERARLKGFRDRICLRDPRGLGRRPALIAAPGAGLEVLEAHGPFTIVQRYSVTPAEGELFADVSRDDNPIHREGDVIPGAMTAARAILLPEILFAGARVERVKFRFRAVARYGESLTGLYAVEPDPESEGVRVRLEVRQGGETVADGQIALAIAESGPPAAGSKGKASRPAAEAASERELLALFCRSLRVEPESYFRFAGQVYPRAYLASLPSGEMVRQFSGEGGILNSIELEFTATPPVIAAAPPPEVELERSGKIRLAFTRVWTKLVSGVKTLGKGVAMVLPGGHEKPILEP